MITRFHMVRHGPTHAKAMVGWTDLPADLSDTAALARLNDALPRKAVVISSDLSRAVHTAHALFTEQTAERRRLPHAPELRELNFGDWEMRSWAEIDAEDPDRIRAFWEQPGDSCAPNGDSWNMIAARVNRQFDQLAEAFSGQHVIVVGHFGQILTQIQRAGAMTTTEAFSHKIDNLSVSEVDHVLTGTSVSWRLGRVNYSP